MPKKQTLEEFIKKSNIAHNFKYNYDKSIYINKQTKVIVICPEHGDFEVTPGAHYILKSGCPECAKISRSKTKSKGLEKFIKQANLKWNSFYNYSKVNYINNYTKVEIICPIHGSFFKDPRSHIDPQRYGGCQSCSKERLSKIISKVQQQKPKGTNREAFIDYCNGIHNNKYSYDKMNYVNMMTPIEIICPIHGTFTQHPINHYQGKGCPECGKHISKSKGEIELCEYIKSIYKGNIISNDRIQLNGKELDVYLPELRLGLGKTILFRFKNDTASQDDMVLYMYGTTSLVGIQGSTLGGGFNVAKQGAVTCENSLLVRGGANFQSGVTLGQTLTVTGITTFLAVPQCSISPTATNQLTNKNYVDETIQQNINTTLEGVIKFASMTEAEYKALEVKSPSTIYYLTDVPLWVIGDQEIVTSNMPA